MRVTDLHFMDAGRLNRIWMDEYPVVKGMVHLKMIILSSSLTLMSFQTCIAFILLWKMNKMKNDFAKQFLSIE